MNGSTELDHLGSNGAFVPFQRAAILNRYQIASPHVSAHIGASNAALSFFRGMMCLHPWIATYFQTTV